jgi:CheY-like chemotaxis protein
MPRISVLVADDNGPIRQLLATTLARHFKVLPTVADGRALVEAAIARRPDVIVSDVNMPMLDGIEAMRVLKQLGCRSAFVLVSAESQLAPHCLELGAAAFVSKERVEDLVPTVRIVAGLPLHACEAEPLPADAERPEVRSRSHRQPAAVGDLERLKAPNRQ